VCCIDCRRLCNRDKSAISSFVVALEEEGCVSSDADAFVEDVVRRVFRRLPKRAMPPPLLLRL